MNYSKQEIDIFGNGDENFDEEVEDILINYKKVIDVQPTSLNHQIFECQTSENLLPVDQIVIQCYGNNYNYGYEILDDESFRFFTIISEEGYEPISRLCESYGFPMMIRDHHGDDTMMTIIYEQGFIFSPNNIEIDFKRNPIIRIVDRRSFLNDSIFDVIDIETKDLLFTIQSSSSIWSNKFEAVTPHHDLIAIICRHTYKKYYQPNYWIQLIHKENFTTLIALIACTIFIDIERRHSKKFFGTLLNKFKSLAIDFLW